MNSTLRRLYFFLFAIIPMPSLCQDTILETYSNYIDFRDYQYELHPYGICHYTNQQFDVENGYYKFHDSISNVLRLKGSVIDNLKNGKWSYFDSSGNLRVEDIFFNDFNSTIYTTYFDSTGFMFKTVESSKNECKLKLYDSYGLNFYRSENDKGDWIHMTFDKQGRVLYQVEMLDGLDHGTRLWRHEDGSLYAEQHFIKGIKTGKWIHSIKGDPRIWCEENYVDDKLISISFYGTKTMVNQPEMTVTDYYENGNKRLEGKVKNGYKSGIWIFYDEKGKKRAQFKHDENGNVVTLSGDLDGIPAI